jgi:hypothetical protein
MRASAQSSVHASIHQLIQPYIRTAIHPSASCLTRVPYEGTLRGCRTRVPYESTLRGCLTRVPCEGALRRYRTRVPCEGTLRGYLAKLPCEGTLRGYLARVPCEGTLRGYLTRGTLQSAKSPIDTSSRATIRACVHPPIDPAIYQNDNPSISAAIPRYMHPRNHPCMRPSIR